MPFYLRVRSNQQNLVEGGLANRVTSLFGLTSEHFDNYTYYIEGTDRYLYYRIENKKYDGIEYDFEQYVIDNYPALPRWTHEQVKEVMPVVEEV